MVNQMVQRVGKQRRTKNSKQELVTMKVKTCDTCYYSDAEDSCTRHIIYRIVDPIRMLLIRDHDKKFDYDSWEDLSLKRGGWHDLLEMQQIQPSRYIQCADWISLEQVRAKGEVERIRQEEEQKEEQRIMEKNW